MIKIRNVRAGDYDEIIPCVNAWWGGREVAPLLPRLFFKHFYDTSFVADADGVIAGFVIGFMSPSNENEAYIHFTGVNPDFRRSGIGRELYKHFFAEAQNRGRDTVCCITSPENSTSIAFHIALGFSVNANEEAGRHVEAIADYDGPQQDRVQFIKTLGEESQSTIEQSTRSKTAFLDKARNTAQFNISEVIEQQRSLGNSWLEFLELQSLSMGVYTIPTGGNDKASHDPHDRDEVYVGVKGRGQLTADGEVYDVAANSVIFVKAGVEHHFHGVTDELTVLVFFAAKK